MTKQQFINELANGHVFLGVTHVPISDEDLPNVSLSSSDTSLIRTVAKRKSNHLEFSDGSRLYFDSFAKRTYEDRGKRIIEMTIKENGSDITKHLFYYVAN